MFWGQPDGLQLLEISFQDLDELLFRPCNFKKLAVFFQLFDEHVVVEGKGFFLFNEGRLLIFIR